MISTRAPRSARRWSPMAGPTTRRCATSSALPRQITRLPSRSMRWAGSSLIEDAPAIASERLGKARAARRGRYDAARRADPRSRSSSRRAMRRSPSRDAMRAHGFFLEALQARREARRAPREDRVGAPLDRQPRCRARELRPRARARAPGSTCCATPSTPRSRPATPTASCRGATICSAAIPTDVRALVARGAAMVAAQPEAARALLELAAARDDVDAHVAARERSRCLGSRARRGRPRSPRCASRRTTARRASCLTAGARGGRSARRGRRDRGARRVPRETRRRADASSVTSSARSRAPPRTSISRCSSP